MQVAELLAFKVLLFIVHNDRELYMIFVNYFDISKITIEQYKKFYFVASEERQKKANRYKNLEDSKRCILAESLLRYSLFQIYPSKSEFVISCNAYGKPYIEHIENFFYNISHSGKWVVVAFGNSEVGVDVEKIGWNSSFDGILNKFYTKEERRYISSLIDENEKAERFTKIWTLKESYIKFLGIGLSKGLSFFSIDGETEIVKDTRHQGIEHVKFKTYFLDGSYMLSICSEEDAVQINEVSLSELKIIRNYK